MVRPSLALPLAHAHWGVRSAWIVPLVCVGLGIGVSPASAVAAAPVGPITVPGQIVEMARSADGGLRVATVTDPYGERGTESSAALSFVSPSGDVTGGTPASGANSSGSSVALTPDGGAITAYAVPGTGTNGPVGSYVAVRAIDANGQPGIQQTISTPGQPASEPGAIAVGPTGSVALTYRELPGNPTDSSIIDADPTPRLAFRAPGATEFAPSAPLDAARSARGFTYRVTLGPNGGGAVLAIPDRREDNAAVRLRRLGPDGTLGPWFAVKIGGHVEMAATTAWSGTTLVVGFRTIDQVKDEIRAKVYATSLAAGPAAAPSTGAKPTKPQRLKGGSDDAFSDTVDLVATARGRVALAVAGRERTVQLFEGRPGKLRATDAVPTRGLALFRLLPRPKGGLSLFWLGSAAKATDVRAFAAHRAKGRKFGKRLTIRGWPAPANPGVFGSTDTSLAAPIILPGNKAAIAYNPDVDSDADPIPATILTTR